MVYVDPLARHGWVLYGKLVMSCHLFADTPTELHELAKAIGLKREWAQDKSSILHYDLTPKKREEAVAAGAAPLDRRAAVEKWKATKSQKV